MNILRSALYSVALLPLLSACDGNGGSMPLDGKKFLSGLEGPKTSSVQDTQREAAKEAEKNNDFAQASQIYKQILEQTPETGDVVQLLADSLRRGGEYDKAINVYDGILAKDPTNLDAKEGKALALLEKGDFETPTVIFDEILKTDGNRWKSLNGMGILFVTRGLYADSIKYFDEASAKSPQNTSVMNNLGLALALNRKFEPAIDILSKAYTGSTASSFGRKRIDLNLALVYAASGRIDESRKIAEKYLTGSALNNNLGLYSHLAKDDILAKSYLNMALTESKTYYGKAWDNLETLNSLQGNNNKNAKQTIKEPKPEETTGNKNAQTEKPKEKDKKSEKNSAPKGKPISVNPEPTATKSEVKPVTAKELHDTKNSPKAKIITVDSVIDSIAEESRPQAKETAQTPAAPEAPAQAAPSAAQVLENSLGGN